MDAEYDKGGKLPAGTTKVTNLTGKPERIYSPQEWRDFLDER